MHVMPLIPSALKLRRAVIWSRRTRAKGYHGNLNCIAGIGLDSGFDLYIDFVHAYEKLKNKRRERFKCVCARKS